MFATNANCGQFLLDMKIIPTKRRCNYCQNRMQLVVYPTIKYRDACCWRCTCGQSSSVCSGSVLHNKNVTNREFIDFLAQFADSKSVACAAVHANVAETTVRRAYNQIQEQIAEDIRTRPKIGGPDKIVEIDEAKFGKRKYSRGRMVEGIPMTASWLLVLTTREMNEH